MRFIVMFVTAVCVLSLGLVYCNRVDAPVTFIMCFLLAGETFMQLS